MKKSKIGFWGWMLLYVLAGLIAILSVMLLLWRYGESYELSQYDNTIRDYVAELNAGELGEALTEAVSAMPHELQSDEECLAYLQQALTGHVRYKLYTGSGALDEKTYQLRCDDLPIGTVTLRQRGDSGFGLMEWGIAEENFDLSGFYQSFSAEVPEGYTVVLNGHKLDESFIEADHLPYSLLEPYYADYPDAPFRRRYGCAHLIGPVESAILDREGENTVLSADIPESTLMANCSAEQLETLRTFSEKFITRYAVYSSSLNDPYAEYGSLMPYILPGSDFEYRMLEARDGLSWMKIIYYVNVDYSVLNWAVRIGDGVYLCDMTASVTTNKETGGFNATVNNWRVVVHDNNGDLRVSAMDTY